MSEVKVKPAVLCLPSNQSVVGLREVNNWRVMADEINKGGEYIERAIAEKDESHLQVCPYIALLTPHCEYDRMELFVYRRGKAGQENRLHQKLSLGVGGHVDFEEGVKHSDAVLLAAQRELKEEVNLDVPIEEIEKNVVGWIYTPEDEVGRVHLGVAIVLPLNRQIHAAPEIADPDSMMLKRVFQIEPHFELWSRAFLSYFREHRYFRHFPQQWLWDFYVNVKRHFDSHKRLAAELEPQVHAAARELGGRVLPHDRVSAVLKTRDGLFQIFKAGPDAKVRIEPQPVIDI